MKKSQFSFAVIVFLLLIAAPQVFSQTLTKISKVDPPNWWAGLPENPMLLVYGAGLEGARITTSYPGVSVDRVEPGNEGYLFVWLKLAANVKPGTAKFVVTGKQGRAELEFPILKRESCDRKIGGSDDWKNENRNRRTEDRANRRATEEPRIGRTEEQNSKLTHLKSETKGPSTPAAKSAAYAQDDRGTCHVGLAKSDVMYLIMPDRFANGDTSNDDPSEAKGHFDREQARAYHGGDLKGVEEHLSYLKDLGVTALWLTPFWKNDSGSADYHGYHVTDFYGVDEHFGSMKDFQELVRATHADGMKFIFDYVVNHIGPYHVWAKNPPLATWLHGTVENHPQFDYHFEYLTDPHAPKAEWERITEGWFPTAPPANALPDLNVDDPHVAKYLLDNAIWWMEMGNVDGFRLDTFPYSSRKFWSYWHRELFRIYPSTNTVGEVYNFDPTITSFFEGGKKRWDGVDDGLWSMFDFPVQSAIRDVLVRNKPADTLQKTMRFDDLYLRPDDLVTFIGNHDTKRFLGEDGATTEKLKAAFGLLMTLRGIPQIYYGDEIGMTGGDDPDNRRDFPGGWQADSENGFKPPAESSMSNDPSKAGSVELTQMGRTPEQQEIFEYVRTLTALRRQHSALRGGHQWTIGSGEKYFVYLRDDGKEKILVVFNEGTEPIKLELKGTPMEKADGLVPLVGASDAVMSNEMLTIDVPRYGAGIYEVK